jgi:hypothetical protein
MGGLNTMSNFSTVYSEYYYYCRISKVEEARRKFICCNSILRDESNGTPLAICLLEDKYKDLQIKVKPQLSEFTNNSQR